MRLDCIVYEAINGAHGDPWNFTTTVTASIYPWMPTCEFLAVIPTKDLRHTMMLHYVENGDLKMDVLLCLPVCEP